VQLLSETTSDEELVVLSLQDPAYFAALIERYETKIQRYLMRRSSASHEDIQDLLQDIFLKAYVNLNGFDTSLSFSSWLYRIAHNHMISWYRKQKIRTDGRIFSINDEDVFEHLADAFDLEHEHWTEVVKKSLVGHVQELPEKYRDIILLRFFEEKDYDEISDILQIPPGTVATRLSRAKKRLQSAFIEHL